MNVGKPPLRLSIKVLIAERMNDMLKKIYIYKNIMLYNPFVLTAIPAG
ncbi:unnamed protein product, partial [marine sediment metagenome]